MEKIKNKSAFFLKIAGCAITIIGIIFVFSLFAIVISVHSSKKNISGTSSTEIAVSIYIVYGKVVSVQSNTISVETPVFNLEKNRWDENKKEIRSLTIDNNTVLKRTTSRPRAGKKNEIEYISNDIALSDFKNEDSVSIKYSKDITRIKDFTPESVTILFY
ncbi:hypothetical protein KKB43_04320 [Patescibacteria group bacterium]|nr:hypothetical protein [Patescibacteria group bacterium]